MNATNKFFDFYAFLKSWNASMRLESEKPEKQKLRYRSTA